LRLREFDAPLDHLAGFADHLGNVEEGFRRDAAAEEAGAAQARVGLDDRGFEPQIGRHKGRRITAGTAAEHDYLRMHTSPQFFFVGLLASASSRWTTEPNRSNPREPIILTGCGVLTMARWGAGKPAYSSGF